jgi:hypothetical protein
MDMGRRAVLHDQASPSPVLTDNIPLPHIIAATLLALFDAALSVNGRYRNSRSAALWHTAKHDVINGCVSAP